MQSVGTQIRVARLQRDLSLEQVSAKTCITVKLLQALENDDLSPISSAFFYRSFVRQFAKEVGLPFESLEEAVAQACAAYPEPLSPSQGEAVIRSAIVRPARKPRNLRWLFPATSLAAVLVACSGFYAFWEGHFGPVRDKTVAPAKQTTNRGAAQTSGQDMNASDATAFTLPSGEGEADGRYHVQLSAVERTWLSIKADGKMVYSGTLEVDQTKIIEGREQGQLRTGNAGGVSIVFNGKPIGLAGPHGSVRTVVFTRDNYQVLPSSVHTALNLLPNPIAGWWLVRPMIR